MSVEPDLLPLPLLIYGMVALLGLTVGSFLNVVILRLPVKLQAAWLNQCAELRGEEPSPDAIPGIARPASRCPSCKTPIRLRDNIPILSYLLLRGRCRSCQTAISPRYPVIEGTTVLLSLAVALTLGFNPEMVAGLVLTWMLIPLAVIDFDHQLLPDNITLPGLWLGLALALAGITPIALQDAVLGAMAGYLSLWSIYHLFRLLTGKEGMGYGDFKLLAMLGAWLGWQALPQIILLSSLVGAIAGVGLIIAGRHGIARPMPFGPYLAVAGWIALLWGDKITRAYLQFSGIQ
ncbi:MAG: A24 family peptidase [Gammaproteobacteria bacterium]|nr:A24 family peptidase [Gammaproteobacteria bacterium]